MEKVKSCSEFQNRTRHSSEIMACLMLLKWKQTSAYHYKPRKLLFQGFDQQIQTGRGGCLADEKLVTDTVSVHLWPKSINQFITSF